jgi:hypothetical protein
MNNNNNRQQKPDWIERVQYMLDQSSRCKENSNPMKRGF